MMFGVILALAAASGDVEVWRASPKHARVVLAPRATPDATLRVVMRVGAADDGIEYGKTRMAQLLLLQGSKGWAAFDEALYAAGASFSMTTGVRDCAFELTAPRGSFDRLAPMMLRMLFAPQAAPDGFAYAKKLATTDRLQAGSEADLYAFVAAQVMLTEGVEGGGDYNNPIWGDIDTLHRMAPSAVNAHIKKRMTPANSTVIAAGAFNAAALKKLMRGFSGGSERPEQRPEIKQYLPLEFSRWAPREVHMHLQVVDAKDAPSIATTHVLAALLQERLFWPLRRTGHVYSPFVTPVFEEWLDFLLVIFTVTPGLDGDADKVMIEQIDEVAAGEVKEDELARAKAMARARLEMLDDDSAALARALAPSSRGVKTVGSEVLSAIDGVDLAALKSAAAHALGRERSVNVLFGKTRAREKRKAALE